ncbi:MAG: DUF3352 domain-containing protein [Bernardetiaceae bacterium]
MKKKIQKILLLLLALGVGALGIYLYLVLSITHYTPIERVPQNAMFVIQTQNAAKAWRKITKSTFWKHLQQQPTFGQLTRDTETVTEAFASYEQVSNWIFSGRDLTLSAHPHPTRTDDYDFLVLADLGSSRALGSIVENLNTYLRDYEITPRQQFRQVQVYQVFERTQAEAEPLTYFAILNNLLILSPNDSLVRLTISGQKGEHFTENTHFRTAKDETMSGIGQLYIQHRFLDQFASYFLQASDPYIKDLSQALYFTTLGLGIKTEEAREIITWQGATTIRDSLSSYVRAAMISGKSTIRAPLILPQSTAFYVGLTFEDFVTFYDNMDAFLQEDEKSYAVYEGNIRRLERYLNIDLREDMMSWMGGEMALVHIDRKDLSPADRFALCIRTNDINFAKDRLAFITDQIRKKTPVKFKTFTYNGHPIGFLSVKGFFKVFLGNYFNKIEKPYFTIIEDYVVFSNSPQTLKSIIDDYRGGLTLARNEDFQAFFARFDTDGTFFSYLNTAALPTTMRGFLDQENYLALQKNRDFVICFSQVGLQLRAEKQYFDTRMVAHFESPMQVRERQATIEEARQKYLTEGNQRGVDRLRSFFGGGEANKPGEMPLEAIVRDNELIKPQAIEALGIQGNIETGYYESGKKKYQARIRNKQRDGLYKEFFEDGSLKIRGRYKNGLQEGVWKYYNPRGTLIETEHYLRGQKELF